MAYLTEDDEANSSSSNVRVLIRYMVALSYLASGCMLSNLDRIVG
jgi:hypothetical protein